MYEEFNIPASLRELLIQEAGNKERVRWAGQPIPGLFTRSALPALAFAIPWTAFAVFWICGASGFKIPDFSKGGFAFFPLFGVPFVLIGLGMLSAPLWALRRARMTLYAITEARALIFRRGIWGNSIQSFSPGQLQSLQTRERSDGSGSITFGGVFSPLVQNNTASNPSVLAGFYYIKNVNAVEVMLRDLSSKPADTH